MKRNQVGSFLRLFGLGLGVEGVDRIDINNPLTWITPILGIAITIWGLVRKGEEAQTVEVKAQVAVAKQEAKADVARAKDDIKWDVAEAKAEVKEEVKADVANVVKIEVERAKATDGQ